MTTQDDHAIEPDRPRDREGNDERGTPKWAEESGEEIKNPAEGGATAQPDIDIEGHDDPSKD